MAGLSGTQALALARKYVRDSLAGAGALKGKSVYELAVEEGFQGSTQEWLNTLGGGETAANDDVEDALDEIFES